MEAFNLKRCHCTPLKEVTDGFLMGHSHNLSLLGEGCRPEKRLTLG